MRISDWSSDVCSSDLGDADRILVVLVRNDRDDGAENLLARDRHVVADVREQRRLDEIAYLDAIGAPGAAGLQRGAFLDPLGDQPLHLLPLRLVDERPDMRSDERRVGNEWVSTCRSRGTPT